MTTVLAAAAAVVAAIAATVADAQERRLSIEPPFRLVRSVQSESDLIAHELWIGDSPVCAPGPDGQSRLGFVLQGTWDARMAWTPDGITMACLGGAAAKCVLAGFHPWDGPADRRRHLACVRMVRADYCGDGVAHTVPGIAIRITDGAGPPPPNLESGWTEDGAVGIERTRLPHALDYVRRVCPDRFTMAPERDALLWND